MTETEQPHTNGLDSVVEEDENNKTRPADIEQDMREMERRKRVEAIMCSRLFREELERIVDGQIKDGPSTIMQQISDMMGVPVTKVGSIFKGSSCVVPINDIRGIEAMGYEKGEKILRCKLAATFRLLDSYGFTHGSECLVTARLNADQEMFLVNPYGLLFHEVTASSLNKCDMQGTIIEQGTTNFGINTSQFVLHSVIHANRPDIRCIINVGHNAVVAVSSTKQGVLPLTKDAAVLGEIAVHNYSGALNEPEEREKLIRSLGPISKVLLLTNHGALCCGETIEEAFYEVQHIVKACEAQLNLLPLGLDNLVLIPEESRKAIYDASRKPPESAAVQKDQVDNKDKPVHQTTNRWRVGGAEFEALMRTLDNAGFRTGYIYRNPLVKHEVPKPKNDVEVPPAVSSLGYLLEEEELYRQGIWKKGGFMKAGDRSRWLNSPNVYQKVEVLETGTPDPKKITKWVDTQAEEWVADGSPTHSTPVKIEHALQFVPTNTNPREFKRIQQQIKDYRRADKISAGPQSHILEGVTWDEANRLKDANVSKTGDHVVLMGAASKGIIQRGYQHNATVYKAPYAKNPFDSVTDDELNEYKRVVEKKRTGEFTDTDYSESEALSSLPISGQVKSPIMSPPSQSEPEDAAHVVMRIETKQAPKPSQPEVVLSDVNTDFLKSEKYETVVTGKPPKKGKAQTNSNKLSNESTSEEESEIQENDTINTIFRLNDTYHGESSTNLIMQNPVTPYRTTSHFGFNVPNSRDPTHFHLSGQRNQFVPLRRSKSFEELFCSDKLLGLSDSEIPKFLLQTVRKKLNFMQESAGNSSTDNVRKESRNLGLSRQNLVGINIENGASSRSNQVDTTKQTNLFQLPQKMPSKCDKSCQTIFMADKSTQTDFDGEKVQETEKPCLANEIHCSYKRVLESEGMLHTSCCLYNVNQNLDFLIKNRPSQLMTSVGQNVNQEFLDSRTIVLKSRERGSLGNKMLDFDADVWNWPYSISVPLKPSIVDANEVWDHFFDSIPRINQQYEYITDDTKCWDRMENRYNMVQSEYYQNLAYDDFITNYVSSHPLVKSVPVLYFDDEPDFNIDELTGYEYEELFEKYWPNDQESEVHPESGISESSESQDQIQVKLYNERPTGAIKKVINGDQAQRSSAAKSQKQPSNASSYKVQEQKSLIQTQKWFENVQKSDKNIGKLHDPQSDALKMTGTQSKIGHLGTVKDFQQVQGNSNVVKSSESAAKVQESKSKVSKIACLKSTQNTPDSLQVPRKLDVSKVPETKIDYYIPNPQNPDQFIDKHIFKVPLTVEIPEVTPRKLNFDTPSSSKSYDNNGGEPKDQVNQVKASEPKVALLTPHVTPQKLSFDTPSSYHSRLTEDTETFEFYENVTDIGYNEANKFVKLDYSLPVITPMHTINEVTPNKKAVQQLDFSLTKKKVEFSDQLEVISTSMTSNETVIEKRPKRRSTPRPKLNSLDESLDSTLKDFDGEISYLDRSNVDEKFVTTMTDTKKLGLRCPAVKTLKKYFFEAEKVNNDFDDLEVYIMSGSSSDDCEVKYDKDIHPFTGKGYNEPRPMKMMGSDDEKENTKSSTDESNETVMTTLETDSEEEQKDTKKIVKVKVNFAKEPVKHKHEFNSSCSFSSTSFTFQDTIDNNFNEMSKDMSMSTESLESLEIIDLDFKKATGDNPGESSELLEDMFQDVYENENAKNLSRKSLSMSFSNYSKDFEKSACNESAKEPENIVKPIVDDSAVAQPVTKKSSTTSTTSSNSSYSVYYLEDVGWIFKELVPSDSDQDLHSSTVTPTVKKPVKVIKSTPFFPIRPEAKNDFKVIPLSPVRRSLVRKFDERLEAIQNEQVGESFLNKIQDFGYSKESPVRALEVIDESDEYAKVWPQIPYLNFQRTNEIERVVQNRESEGSLLEASQLTSAENVENSNLSKVSASTPNSDDSNLGSNSSFMNIDCSSISGSSKSSFNTSGVLKNPYVLVTESSVMLSDDSKAKDQSKQGDINKVFETPKVDYAKDAEQEAVENPDKAPIFLKEVIVENPPEAGPSNQANQEDEAVKFSPTKAKEASAIDNTEKANKDLNVTSVPDTSIKQTPKSKRNFVSENIKNAAIYKSPGASSKVQNPSSIFSTVAPRVSGPLRTKVLANLSSIFSPSNPFASCSRKNDQISTFSSKFLWVTMKSEEAKSSSMKTTKTVAKKSLANLKKAKIRKSLRRSHAKTSPETAKLVKPEKVQPAKQQKVSLSKPQNATKLVKLTNPRKVSGKVSMPQNPAKSVKPQIKTAGKARIVVPIQTAKKSEISEEALEAQKRFFEQTNSSGSDEDEETSDSEIGATCLDYKKKKAKESKDDSKNVKDHDIQQAEAVFEEAAAKVSLHQHFKDQKLPEKVDEPAKISRKRPYKKDDDIRAMDQKLTEKVENPQNVAVSKIVNKEVACLHSNNNAVSPESIEQTKSAETSTNSENADEESFSSNSEPDSTGSTEIIVLDDTVESTSGKSKEENHDSPTKVDPHAIVNSTNLPAAVEESNPGSSDKEEAANEELGSGNEDAESGSEESGIKVELDDTIEGSFGHSASPCNSIVEDFDIPNNSPEKAEEINQEISSLASGNFSVPKLSDIIKNQAPQTKNVKFAETVEIIPEKLQDLENIDEPQNQENAQSASSDEYQIQIPRIPSNSQRTDQLLESQRQYLKELAIRDKHLENTDTIAQNINVCLTSKENLAGKLDKKIKTIDNKLKECGEIQLEMDSNQQRSRERLEDEKRDNEMRFQGFSTDVMLSED